MTIIAVKDNIMAADGVESACHMHYPMAWGKISRGRDGSLVGIGGVNTDAYTVHLWVTHGMDFSDVPKLQPLEGDDNPVSFLWLKPDGSLWCFSRLFNGYPLASDVYTLGASTAVAFVEGAMRAGASAEKAVRLACEHINYIKGPVQVERLECAAAEKGHLLRRPPAGPTDWLAAD